MKSIAHAIGEGGEDGILRIAQALREASSDIDQLRLSPIAGKLRIGSTLPDRFRGLDFLFSGSDDVWRRIEHEGEVRFGDDPADQAQQPHRTAVAIAKRIHQRIHQMAIVQNQPASGQVGVNRK